MTTEPSIFAIPVPRLMSFEMLTQRQYRLEIPISPPTQKKFVHILNGQKEVKLPVPLRQSRTNIGEVLDHVPLFLTLKR